MSIATEEKSYQSRVVLSRHQEAVMGGRLHRSPSLRAGGEEIRIASRDFNAVDAGAISSIIRVLADLQRSLTPGSGQGTEPNRPRNRSQRKGRMRIEPRTASPPKGPPGWDPVNKMPNFSGASARQASPDTADGTIPAAMQAHILGLAMKPDWDGVGAHAIPASACHAAISFLRETIAQGIPHPKFIGPSPLGGIALQWNTSDYRLKVRVFGPGPSECYYQWVRLPNSVSEGRGQIISVAKGLAKILKRG